MSNKTLLDAVETELRNARAALNTAGRYLDAIRVASNNVVVSEAGESFFPIGTDAEDESIVYGLKIDPVSMALEEALRKCTV
jgi:hypothetical protein